MSDPLDGAQCFIEVDVCSQTSASIILFFFFPSNVVEPALASNDVSVKTLRLGLSFVLFSFLANGLSAARGAIHHMHYLKSGASIKIRDG